MRNFFKEPTDESCSVLKSPMDLWYTRICIFFRLSWS